MNRDSMELLLQYNRWANNRVLELVGPLSGEQFLKNLGSSYGSVRDTLEHILTCEERWLMRWKGISPREAPESSQLRDVSQFKSRWADYDHDVTNFFSKMSDESLLEVISFEDTDGVEWSYPLWHMMHHTLNHSTYHRGQITMMLRLLDAKTLPLDFLDFIDERKS